MKYNLRSQKGLTLIELVMVIIIIGIIAGVAMKSMDSAIETGRVESTKSELNELAHAIAGNPDLVNNGTRSDFGYVGDVGSLPPDLEALATNPGGYSTWNGPYIQSDFTQASDDYRKDGWGSEYVYGGGVTIISNGSGSDITRQFAGSVADLADNGVKGTVLDAEGIPPGIFSSDVEISLEYPDGSGSMTGSTINPSPNGNYIFGGIPVGHHILTAINSSTNDTVISYVTVLPRSSIVNNIRFGSALWGAGNSSNGSGIQYVAGSASIYGSSGQNVRFEIFNDTGEDITITWLKATYDHIPAAYYERIRWSNANVANSSNPRYSSGDQVNFSSSKSINNGEIQTIELEIFRDSQTGGGSYEYMAGTTFTVQLSDNSEISFSP